MSNKAALQTFQEEVKQLAKDADNQTYYEAALRPQSAIAEYAKQTAEMHCVRQVPKLSDNKQFIQLMSDVKSHLLKDDEPC